MFIIRSITLTKAKETIMFPYRHCVTFIWLKPSNFKSSWPFNRGIKQTKIMLGTARSWPWPLNRGGHWIEVFITVYSWQFFQDFGRRLPNKGWPLNRGSTVIAKVLKVAYYSLSQTQSSKMTQVTLRKNENNFKTWIPLNHFSFKRLSNKCLNLELIKWDQKSINNRYRSSD